MIDPFFLVPYILVAIIVGIAFVYEWLSGRRKKEELVRVIATVEAFRRQKAKRTQPEDQKIPCGVTPEQTVRTLERETEVAVRTTAKSVTLEHEVPLEHPSKEDLTKLKAALSLTAGSLQYKKGSIYHITYDSQSKKHKWSRLGLWNELKDQL